MPAGQPPGVLLASLRETVPGVECLAALLRLDPAGLGDDDALSFLEVLERHVGWLHALQASALVAVAGLHPSRSEVTVVRPPNAGKPPAGDGAAAPEQEPAGGLVEICLEDLVREEVACALRWSSGYAQARIDGARLLAGGLGRVREALAEGLISPAHAAVIVDGARRLPGYGSSDTALRATFELGCGALQERALAVAPSSTVARTRRAVGVAVASLLDTHGASDGKGRWRWRGHEVLLLDEADGSAALLARMPIEHAHACMAAITALARDPRLEAPCEATAGERRALALACLLTGTAHLSGGCLPEGRQPGHLPDGPLPGGPLPREGWELGPRPRVHLDVVITLDALLGLTAQPAQLSGGEPIPAEAVRGMLADATMRRLVTDPLTGQLLDYGRRTYRVPDALRRLVQARDRTCRFPGCGRRATGCQVDHAIAWDDGGTTAPANLGALCTRHHQAKTHGGWSITDSRSDGSCTWHSPLGRRYHRRPAPPLEPPLRPPLQVELAPDLPSPDDPPPDDPPPDDPPF